MVRVTEPFTTLTKNSPLLTMPKRIRCRAFHRVGISIGLFCGIVVFSTLCHARIFNIKQKEEVSIGYENTLYLLKKYVSDKGASVIVSSEFYDLLRKKKFFDGRSLDNLNTYVDMGSTQVSLKGRYYRPIRPWNDLKKVTDELTLVSDRPGLRNNLIIVLVDQPDAFSLPGGFIFLTSGMLKVLGFLQPDGTPNTMADLSPTAGVIAHEIAHVAKRHSAKSIERRMSQRFFLNVLLSVLANKGKLDWWMEEAAAMGIDIHNRHRSRGQERTADRLGLTYIQKSGKHRPEGLVEALSKLLKLPHSDAPDFMRTHPSLSDRCNALRASIRGQKTFVSTVSADVGPKPEEEKLNTVWILPFAYERGFNDGKNSVEVGMVVIPVEYVGYFSSSIEYEAGFQGQVHFYPMGGMQGLDLSLGAGSAANINFVRAGVGYRSPWPLALRIGLDFLSADNTDIYGNSVVGTGINLGFGFRF